MASDDVVDILKPFRDQFKERVLKSGKRRIRIEITPKEGPYLDFSERAILAPIAAAVLDELRKSIAGVPAVVKPETIGRRKRYASQLRGGKVAALRRYAGPGGRGLAMPGSQGDHALGDSGRMLSSIVAGISGTKPVRVTINVAANRLDPSTFNEAEWARYMAQLRRWVPALMPGAVFRTQSVQNAIAGVMGDRLAHVQAEIARKRAEMGRMVLSLVRGVAEMAA